MMSTAIQVLPWVVGLVFAGVCVSSAQAPRSACEVAFVDCARRATTRYEDQRLAILDGYRPIGRESPAMGQHWIRLGLVFDGEFDPARPEILTYVTVTGSPRLTGVAYAIPLLAGEAPPRWPAGESAWHYHFRTLTDETLVPDPHAGHGQSPRVAMLHTWFWPENPAGVFAADNWALPYARLGLTPADDVEAAKTLALLSGGEAFFRAAIHASVTLSETEERLADEAFRRATAAAATLFEARSGDGSPSTVDDVERLAAVWSDLWIDLEGVVGAVARGVLRSHPLR
jgi:hypothetical protein